MHETDVVYHEGLRGRLVRPKQPNGAGVLLMPGWAGLDERTDETAQRLADEGFTVVGWDPFSAHEPDLPAEDRRRITNGELLDVDAQKEHGRWLDFMEGELGLPGLGTIGFCMGGRMCMLITASDPRVKAVSAFYPTLRSYVAEWTINPYEAAQDMGAAIQIHYPQRDRVTPPESMVKLRTALEARESLAPTTVHFYPEAQHGFLTFDGNRDRPDCLASQVAWPATIANYRSTLLEGVEWK
jgi:carboxymethylenebutenolidase